MQFVYEKNKKSHRYYIAFYRIQRKRTAFVVSVGLLFMKTYLIQDGEYYKIGRAFDVNKRLCNLTCSNIRLKIVSFGYADIEYDLHKIFEKKRIKREWFCLNDADVSFIINKFGNPNEDELEYKDFVIDFGEYKGRYLISMITEYEINYIKTLLLQENKCPFYRHWFDNHLRYINIIRPHKFYKDMSIINKEIISLEQSLNEKQKIELLIKIGSSLNLKTIKDYASSNKITYNGAKKCRKPVELFGVKFIIDNN